MKATLFGALLAIGFLTQPTHADVLLPDSGTVWIAGTVNSYFMGGIYVENINVDLPAYPPETGWQFGADFGGDGIAEFSPRMIDYGYDNIPPYEPCRYGCNDSVAMYYSPYAASFPIIVDFELTIGSSLELGDGVTAGTPPYLLYLSLADGLYVVTPLPTTFPLFAAGLGVMGLFGWRRKREA